MEEAAQADAGRVNVLGPLGGSEDVRAAWEALDTDRQRMVIETLMTRDAPASWPRYADLPAGVRGHRLDDVSWGGQLTSPPMRRVVLDCNAVDPLVDLPGAFDVVKRAVESGELELLGTHILEEELAAIPNVERRAKLQKVLDLTRDTRTGGFLLGASALDRARLSNDFASIDALRAGRTDLTHTNDALLAHTCTVEGCALVTNEEKGGSLRSRALRQGIEVLRSRELLAELGYRARAGVIDWR